LKCQVTTLLRDGVKGSEEEVVKQALLQLGYNEITGLKMGQSFYLTLDDNTTKEKIEEMCNRVLVNTILYNFKIVEE
jgi:phosphoribosylformylglycinamidine synthase